MTIKEIRQSDKDMLTPSDIAELLNADPQTIRIAARVAPERLGFPVVVIGNRVRIPKIPFLALFEPRSVNLTEAHNGG